MFGPTDPRRTGPYGQVDHVLQHKLPCIPCMRASCSYCQPLECLRAITPDRVSSRVESLLRRSSPRPALNSTSSARVD
jgi:ADP-heptose:LPS heptosyltransferase